MTTPMNAPITDPPTLDDFNELLHQRDQAAAERDRLAAIVADVQGVTNWLADALRDLPAGPIPSGIAYNRVHALRHALAGERR